MLTVVEYKKDGKRIYTIEAIDVGKYKNSAGQLIAVTQGEKQIPIAEFVDSIAKRADLVNEGVSKVVDENGERASDRGERAPRQDERRWSVAREQAKDLTAPLGVSLQELKKTLKALAGKDLKNDETGIVAQVNSVQRNKMSSNAAIRKSVDNGFTKEY